MSKVVGAVSLSLIVASAGAAWSQEIVKVTAPPNAGTGELVVQTVNQPVGETVYIVRDGQLVSEAKIADGGAQAGTVIQVPADAIAKVQVGDSITLAPPAGVTVKTVRTEVTTTEVGAPEPAAAAALPEPVPASQVSPELSAPQLEKGVSNVVRSQTTIAHAKSTPRGMGVPMFPAPARVNAEAGVMGPYGQGLAAAAPVGTPYLRSPAFAGPPIIYMPQTVTRVLLPGATPYPSNIMSPPAAYSYASAPFLRTDIYTSMPYGTFYWPQGYAGTTPVEPQVPAYVTAPASAILSTEADYSAGRYVPGVAHEETLNPISAGINSNLLGTTAFSTAEGGTAAQVSATVPQTGGLTVAHAEDANTAVEAAIAGTPAPVSPFPVLSDGAASAAPAPTPAAPLPTVPTPALVVPTPALVVPTPDGAAATLPNLPSATPDGASAALPSLPENAPAAGLPSLPEAGAQAPGLPSLPEAGAAAPGLPSLPDAGAAAPALPTLPQASPAAGLPELPATPGAAAGTPTAQASLPSLPETSAAPAAEVIVDATTPNGLTLTPQDAWTPSADPDAPANSSLIARVEPGQVKTATFNATIPADGVYQISLRYFATEQFRSNAVPVTINTATGPQQTTIDQTQGGDWHTLGTYALKAGENVPVVTLSTEGLEGAGSNISVSAGAMRLVPQP